MNQTPARTQFKKHLGNANHLLITALVGLHELEGSSVESAPPELRTAWSPASRIDSINRSHIFVMHSFLGWAVDSLDMYASLLYRKPNFLQDPAVCSAMDGAGRSVWKKVHRLSEHYTLSGPSTALVDVMIAWRNNVFHELADNVICDKCAKALETYEHQIRQDYRGLDPSDLPHKAASGAALTFKETASLINAAQHFVQELDAAVLDRLDTQSLCLGLVTDRLGEDRGFRDKYFRLPVTKRSRFLGNWLANAYGITDVGDDILSSCSVLPSPAREVRAT